MPNPLRRRRLGGGGLVDPRSLPGLALWLKADAINGVANGGGIATWPDSSGNGVSVTQATGGSQPTWTTNARNSLPAVTSNGTTATMGVTLSYASTSHTLITATNPAITTAGTRLWDANTGRIIFAPAGADTGAQFGIFDGVWRDLGVGATGWQIDSFALDGGAGTVKGWKNGALVGSGSYTAHPMGGATALFSHNAGATNFYQGVTGEVILYQRVLLDYERTFIESYLNRRYAIF